MSIAFNAFGIILLVSRSFAVMLSVCLGVSGWGWPSSLSMWHIETAVFALMKRAPSSASCWVRCMHFSNYKARGASGNYEAWGASGNYEARGASGNYEARGASGNYEAWGASGRKYEA